MQTIRGLWWGLIPFVLYALVLRHLWFNAPIWDDYDTILASVTRMMDAASPGEWWGIVVSQHNEHRIAVMRLVAWAVAALTGTIDFRVLVAIGNLTVVGMLVLFWAEFRGDVAAPLFAAAGFLLFQWSYYEAALMGSAALPNIGVVFFSFACLYFSMRGGAAGAAACVLFGMLASGSQANGLFALPLAAAASAFAGRRRRAGLLAAVALALWAGYFLDYSRPAGHPAVTAALENPLGAAKLFTIVIGGLAPLGALMLVLLGWLTGKGAWKAHPTAALWVAFVLLSAAAATVGRIGYGVIYASRYAIYPSSLAVIVFLAACAVTRPWKRPAIGAAILAGAAASLAISWVSWPRALEYSRQGGLLGKVAAPDGSGPQYVGVLYPSYPRAARFLEIVEKRGLYSPPAGPTGAARRRLHVVGPGANCRPG